MLDVSYVRGNGGPEVAIRVRDFDGQVIGMSVETPRGAITHADARCGLGGRPNSDVQLWRLPIGRLAAGIHRLVIEMQSSTCAPRFATQQVRTSAQLTVGDP